MASNVFQINAYQIDQKVVPLANVTTYALPTTGVVAVSTINSPTRNLSTGVNVYSMVEVVASGTLYYCRETFSALVTLINA